MIAIRSEGGSLVKLLPKVDGEVLGFHDQLGFVSEESGQERLHVRQRRGLAARRDLWRCRFAVAAPENQKHWDLYPIEGCKAEKVGENEWKLVTDFGSFDISERGEAPLLRATIEEERDDKMWRWFGIIALLVPLFYFFRGSEEVPPPVAVMPDPIAVKVVTVQPKAVRVPSTANVPALPEAVTRPKDTGGKNAAPQELGFLGIAGKKDLKKALGGMPSNLSGSPGAGAGGDQGSGGEMLTGLGQGVKRTTVGNTGVAGLGGVGGKNGPGGGGGGYGDTLLSSGSGAGVGRGNGTSLSALARAQDLVLDGGLDRAVVQATIAKYLSQVRACYEAGLKRNSGLNGTVSMNFEVGASGKLNYAKVGKSSLGDVDVSECIARRMLDWEFPKPLGGVNVKVSYPFLLRPVNS